MRKYLRKIAKARMKAMGYPSPNRLMKKNWREMIIGEKADAAEKIQAEGGRKLRRKLKKVPA